MFILTLESLAKMARKFMIYIIIALIIISLIACLSLAIRAKNQKIETLQSEIKSKDEKIEEIRAEMAKFKDEMNASQKASEVHSQEVSEAVNEYIKKVELIKNDPDAVDWLGQRLPDAVLYNFNTRSCENPNH